MSVKYPLVALLLGASTFWPPAASSANDPASQPNILLIFADDVGSEVLSCYGGQSYSTPRLDALAAAGCRMTHCYSMPVCHPSRVTLLTGRYPFRSPAGWGSFPQHATTVAHVLKDAGYATAVAGKWQLALQKKNPDHPTQLGFDQSCLFGWHEGPRYHQPFLYRNGKHWAEKEKPDVFGPDVYCDFLIQFMQQNRQGPFFAFYSMALCHEISDDFEPVPPPAPDGHYLSFAEMVSNMDRCVGRILDALDRLHLSDNTLVLFTTDNGSPKSYLTGVTHRDGNIVRGHEKVVSLRNGREIRGGKGELTDAGTRVPLLARWPGRIRPGSTSAALIDFSDFLPTFAELAGAELPQQPPLDGQSFTPALLDKAHTGRPWVYCQRADRFWVRNQDWKLYSDGKLFDMQRDPEEKNPSAAENDSAPGAAARQKLKAAAQLLR